MAFPLLLLSALPQGPLPPAPPVLEPSRIALTPVLDGKVEPEEWDPFGSDPAAPTFFQWEPRALHFGGRAPAGSDLLLTVDLNGDGWLVGRDNFEVRVPPTGPAVVRRLDATDRNGPKWSDAPGLASAVRVAVGAPDPAGIVIEATLNDPGDGSLPDAPKGPIGVRLDFVPTASAPAEPYLPRPTTPVTLGYFRSAGLPAGLVFRPEGESKSVVPGQTIRIRSTFEGKNELGIARALLRAEGDARNAASVSEVPFPPFDRKGRSFVDWDTAVAAGARPGYRLFRAEVVGKDGLPGVAQTSFRVARPVDADLIPGRVPAEDKDRVVRRGFYLRSNSGRPLSGRLTILVPEPMRTLDGTDRRFGLSSSRARSRQSLDVFVPKGTRGTFPITFRIETSGETYEQTGFVTIE